MRGQPVLNTEFGYQHEPGHELERNHATRQCHHPSTVRKKAWKIAAAGALLAAGFEGTEVRNFAESDVDNFRPQQLEVLHDFFTGRTEYWKMSPHLELVASHNVLLALLAGSPNASCSFDLCADDEAARYPGVEGRKFGSVRCGQGEQVRISGLCSAPAPVGPDRGRLIVR